MTDDARLLAGSLRPLRRTLLGFLLLTILGCETDLDPFTSDVDLNAFAVTGYLDTAADTQFVRIERVRQSLARTPPAPNELTVTTRNEMTGEELVWQDSLVALDDDSTGLLYYARFRPGPDVPYLLEVRSTDGRSSTATTRTPDSSALSVPAIVDESPYRQALLLPELGRTLSGAEIVYRIAPDDGGPVFEVPIEVPSSMTAEGVLLNFPVELHQQAVRERLGLRTDDPNDAFHGAYLRTEQRSDAWTLPPGASNVTNGLGRFAALGRYRYPWTLPPSVVNALGYIDRQER